MRSSAASASAVAAAALAYCVWLGWHWLPLDYSQNELAGFVSRLWDVRRELAEHGSLPWWTPNYLGGSDYALLYSQGLFLLPALAFAEFFDLLTAAKLTALLAIFASAMTMFFCARHFLRNDWGAVLAALVFLLHPQQVIRAAGVEHLGISVFLPLVPLTWLLFARALESRRSADAFWCALAVSASLWAHNKMAFLNLLFLAAYLVYWAACRAAHDGHRASRLEHAGQTLRTGTLIGALALGVSACFVVPALTEARNAKLFEGESFSTWQAVYSFKSLLALVDRDAALTRGASEGAREHLVAHGVRDQAELERSQRVVRMSTDSPEKYAGIVLLSVLTLTVLVNHRRQNRKLFRFLLGGLLATIMLAHGPSSIWNAHLETGLALSSAAGVPLATQLAFVLLLLAAVALLRLLYLRKLVTVPGRLIATGALLVFLFVPAFPIVAWLPFFQEIRAPYSFYDVNGTFFIAMLSGFLVTDVLRSRLPLTVGLLALALFVDYWPYQAPVRDNGVSAATLANMRAAYASMRDPDEWGRVYMLTSRAFRVLVPVLTGRPLVYEYFYNWMAPKGTGYLNTQARDEPALFDLLGARYVIFDRTDPRMAGAGEVLESYRRRYPVHHENADFAVFHNPDAMPYLAAYAAALRYEGELIDSAKPALALAQRKWPLIHAVPGDGSAFDGVVRGHGSDRLPERDGRAVELRVETLVRRSHGEVRAVLEVAEPSWLVINESYHPNWRAILASVEVPLHRAFTGLMAVRLPAGRHELTLEYSVPRSYFVAQLLSGAVLLGGLGACLLWLRMQT